MSVENKQLFLRLLKEAETANKEIGRLTSIIERLRAENTKLRLMNGIEQDEFIHVEFSHLSVVR